VLNVEIKKKFGLAKVGKGGYHQGVNFINILIARFSYKSLFKAKM